MRLNILIILTFGFLFSCTDEPTLTNFNVTIKNGSLSTLKIIAYNEGTFVNQLSLITGESGLNCAYSDETFIGYKLTYCQIDSIVFKFNNNKGYISSINYPTVYDFLGDNNPFGVSEKFIFSESIYQFIITEDDFNNAFDLPE